MSFMNGKPWVATEQDCKASWCGRKHGQYFRCGFCGHKFAPGDLVRWQYTNGTDAPGNPLVCQTCDADRDTLVARFRAMHQEARGRMWWFCRRRNED